MNIYITLDYELFFGENVGSIDNCIIKPTNKLLQIVNPLNIKLVLFVDSGYLVALKKFKKKYPILEEDYKKIINQIKDLSNFGHKIELHVHPHWEDSFFNGNRWILVTNRYKLSDFKQEEISTIVSNYSKALTEITGVPLRAYRAGGWSAQPFSDIGEALVKNNIFIDSTVYPKGYQKSAHQNFDFRNINMYCNEYRFNDNLTVPTNNGLMKEIPISSYKLRPIFFWKFGLIKVFGSKQHNSFGDGSAIKMNRLTMIRLLLTSSYSVVSIDGYKSSFIKKAFKKHIKKTNNNGNFVLIGHPKAFSDYSLKKLSDFIQENINEHNFVTY